MRKNAGFIQIVIILIVLALIGGVYYFETLKNKQSVVSNIPTSTPTTSPISSSKPTTEPTANWKTYTNIKYHYSISYPSSWWAYIQNSDPDLADAKKDSSYINIWQTGKDGGQFGTAGISIGGSPNNYNSSYVDWTKSITWLNGIQATKYEITRDSKLLTDYVLGPINGYYLDIGLTFEVNDPDVKTLDQILSTFKLTN